jgi:UDP:flavonoid glycosyltransferase YjiC (YdhE family)
MRISVVAMGSRGDVQPMMVLADELRTRGHEVTLGVPPDLVWMGISAGLRTESIGPDIRPVLEVPEAREWLASRDFRALGRRMEAMAREAGPQLIEDIPKVCADAEVMIAGVFADDIVLSCAEAAGVPFFAVHFAPYRPSSAYLPPVVTGRSLPGFLNLAGGHLFQSLCWAKFGGDPHGLRRRLGMGPTWRATAVRMARRGDQTLQAFSPVVVPNLPARASTPVVGFFSLRPELHQALGDAALDDDLVRWIGSGESPVYVGFGSMPVADERVLDIVRTSAERLGIRIVLSSGWSSVAATSDDRLRVVGKVDHDQVFPHCRAVVHHGGAGTTAAGLAVGAPTVVCSVFFDQPFWGSRVEQLGAGVHLCFKNLSVSTLCAALTSALEPATVRAAARTGTLLREDRPGQCRSADLIEAAALRNGAAVA